MRQFHDAQIKVSRLKQRSGNLRAYVATATADASVQPLGKDAVSIREGVYGSSYQAFVEEDVDIQKGDRVVSDGVTYSVTDVIDRPYGAFPYKEVVLKRT